MPIVTTSIAGKAAIDIARKVIADNLGKKEARRLTVYYWGAVLFELRSNITDAQGMTRPGNDHRYGIFTFRAWDALFEVILKLAPMNRMFSTVREINDQFREISLLLRAALDAPGETGVLAGSLGSMPVSTNGGGNQWANARLQATELVPRAVQVFNDTRSIVEDIARGAFDANEWQTQEAEILPDVIP